MNTKLLIARRLAIVTAVAAVFSLLAYGVGYAVRGEPLPWEHNDSSATPRDAADNNSPESQQSDAGAPEADEPAPSEGTQAPAPKPKPKPTQPSRPAIPPAGPALYSQGDNGPEVRDIQARLKQIDWFSGDVTDHYGDVTTEAIRGFQAKRGFEVTGEVDRRTLDRLHEMTREPTQAELTNQPPPSNNGNSPGALDPRCQTGRVLCIDKSSNTLRWVVDGDVRKTLDVRFGSDELPTREGQFAVNSKSRDHVSSLYDTPMPFAMFFSGGQAVHYSPDFVANGYNGASHGCVNVRDRSGIEWLFDEVQVGDKVIVYWS